MTEAGAATTDVSQASEPQFALLLDLIARINEGASLETVFALVANALREIFGIDRFALVLLQGDGTYHITSSVGLSETYLDTVRQSIAEGAGARALRARRPEFITDVTVGDAFAPLQDAAREEGFRSVLILPLFAGADPLGYLIMYHDAIRVYTAAEILLAQALAQQAAAAVQSARLLTVTEDHRLDLEERFRQRVAEAEATDDILLTLTTSLDLDHTLRTIVDSVAGLAQADQACLYLRQDDGLYHAVATFGVALEDLTELTLSPEQGMIAQLCQTCEPLEVLNFGHEVRMSERVRDFVSRSQIHAVLAVPLVRGKDVVGALYVSRTKPESFGTDLRRTLLRFVAFAQVAIQNAQRFAEIRAERSRSHLLGALLELSADLNSELSASRLQERVVEAAMHLVGASGGTIGLVENDSVNFHRRFWRGEWVDAEMSIPRDAGVTGLVWRTGQPYLSNDARHDPHILSQVVREFGYDRVLSVPVLDHSGSVMGIVHVHDTVDDRDFDPSDIEVLQLLAHQAAIALENARLNQQKDEFLSIVSHELKTPVTSIKGFTQVLQRRLSPESLSRAGRYLEILNTQADRLTALINDLLDVSRIERESLTFPLQPLDYGALIAEVVGEMRLVAPNNPIDLTAPSSMRVMGNADRLRQVLVNLIDNGIKHGPSRGTVRITVETDQAEARTYVCDEGQGLPAEEVERIFDRYYQAHRTPGRSIGGLGLGLYISRQIVERHGGRIWLDDVDHTSFCFTVPLADSR